LLKIIKIIKIDMGDKSNFLVDFFAAGLSAVIAKTTVAPIERVKALL